MTDSVGRLCTGKLRSGRRQANGRLDNCRRGAAVARPFQGGQARQSLSLPLKLVSGAPICDAR